MADPASHPTNLEVIATGSTREALAGATAIVLTILGLTRLKPVLMAAVATMIIGGALLMAGVTVGLRVDRLAPLQSRERTELASGMSAEFLAGVAGFALGVLAVLGVSSVLLLAIAPIVFGAGLFIGSAMISRLNFLTFFGVAEPGQEPILRAARYTVSAAARAQTLVALAAMVLGILALLGFHPLVLALVALLSIGGTLLLSGGAVSGKVLNLLAG
jgi:hypothetical protein